MDDIHQNKNRVRHRVGRSKCLEMVIKEKYAL